MQKWTKHSSWCEDNKFIINTLQLKFASHVNLTLSSVNVNLFCDRRFDS